MFAVRLVALLTVTEFTVIPAPRFTVVLPCTQWVNWPAMATFRLLVPCWPVFGLTLVIAGVCANIAAVQGRKMRSLWASPIVHSRRLY